MPTIMARARRVGSVIWIALTVLSSPLVTAADESPVDKAFEEKVMKIVRDHPREIIEILTAYQRAEAERREQSMVDKLKAELEKTPTAELVGDSPARGAADNKLLLVEFSDFQCPYCGRAFSTIDRFMQGHANEVRLVFKNLPLVDLHPEAANAARAAWAAQQQGRFWEYHDALFKAQDLLGEKRYIAIAQELHLDRARFDQDRNGDAARTAINQDLALAKKFDINATPLFILNKVPISGAVPLAEFERLLTEAKAGLGK